MSIQNIDRSGWATYFDTLTKMLIGKRAEVEVASLGLGDQVASEWQPLIGITYDHKDDLIEVALEDLDHLIQRPSEVYVDYGVGGALVAIEIVDSEGTRQIVRLKDPLALPPPQHRSAEAIR